MSAQSASEPEFTATPPSRSRRGSEISSRSSSCWPPGCRARRSMTGSHAVRSGASIEASIRRATRRSRPRRRRSRRSWHAGRAPRSAACRRRSIYGCSRFPTPLIEVVSPRRRKVAGAQVHHCRTLNPRDLTDHLGIPITTAHRMFVDLADALTPHQLANVIHKAAYRGRYVEAAIRDVMARMNGRHNLAALERAMELHRMGSAGTKSGAEDAFLRLPLPEPLVNMHLLGREVDFHWPEQRRRSRGRRDPRPPVDRGRRRRARRGARGRRLHGPALQRPRRLRAPGRGHRSNRRGVGVQPRSSACRLRMPFTKRPLEGATRNSSNSISLHG